MGEIRDEGQVKEVRTRKKEGTEIGEGRVGRCDINCVVSVRLRDMRVKIPREKEKNVDVRKRREWLERK